MLFQHPKDLHSYLFHSALSLRGPHRNKVWLLICHWHGGTKVLPNTWGTNQGTYIPTNSFGFPLALRFPLHLIRLLSKAVVYFFQWRGISRLKILTKAFLRLVGLFVRFITAYILRACSWFLEK